MHDAILFLTGLVVGSMNAIAGGGMLVGFPVLLALGAPAIVANATTSLIVLPGGVSATYGYRRYLHRVPRQYLLLLIPAVLGSYIGASLLKHTSPSSFEHYVPGLILVAVVLFAFQPYLYRLLHRHLHRSKSKHLGLQPLIVLSLAVIPISIYGGYFGAGFGFIMLAFLAFTKLHNHIHRMNALKNIMTIAIACTSLSVLYNSHLIEWHHGLIMGAGCLIGAYYGSVVTRKLPTHAIRIIVIAIGLGTTTYLTSRSY